MGGSAAIRTDDQAAAVPVVFTSVLDERARGLAMGAAAYLVKPIGRAELLGALGDVITTTVGPTEGVT